MSMRDLIQQHWLQTKVEDTNRRQSLPLTSVNDFIYWDIVGDETRIYTAQIFSKEDETPVLIAEDDGEGNLTEVVSGVLNQSGTNTINYTENKITISWDPTYIISLSENPYLNFKIVSKSEEEHIEFKDFLAEVLETYKQQELDAYLSFYDPENIPIHQIDALAEEHNWTVDRIFSEDETYLRKQLKSLYNLYKNRRTKDAINFAISIIRKKVIVYNLLALKGSGTNIPINDSNFWVVNQETIDNYNNFSTYERFNIDLLLKQSEDNPTLVQNVFDLLYSDNCDYYPTKHFLVDLSMSFLNDDGSLLSVRDIETLKNYILAIKSQSQYPHFDASIFYDSSLFLDEQNNSIFDFKLKNNEIQFSLSGYEEVMAAPNGVYSYPYINGAWVLIPFTFNSQHSFNSGLSFNMNAENLNSYYKYMKIGTGSIPLGDISQATDLQTPVKTFTTLLFEDDANYIYITATVPMNQASNIEITEMGIFNLYNQLSFYTFFPKMVKTDEFSIKFKIRIPKTI